MPILKIILIILTLSSGIMSIPALSGAQGNVCHNQSGGYCVNFAAIANPTPGLEFLGETPESLGKLISLLYKFGMGLVGISALVVLIFGGVMYMSARDSQDQIKRARAYMGNAILGLVLALTSWLILYTINPDLVKELDLNLIKITISGSLEKDRERAKLSEELIKCGAGEISPGCDKIKSDCAKKEMADKCYCIIYPSKCSAPAF